eukprot:1145757-Pelagomonas_calceolata.AAC.4
MPALLGHPWYCQHSRWLTLEHPQKQHPARLQQAATWALGAHPGVQLQGWGCSLRHTGSELGWLSTQASRLSAQQSSPNGPVQR